MTKSGWRRDWCAFAAAALAAPALSVVFAILMIVATTVLSGQSGDLSAFGGVLFGLGIVSIAATACGIIPAILFGAPVFWVLVAARTHRPGLFVHVLGGMGAAALYVVSALALAGTGWNRLQWMYFWVLTSPSGGRFLDQGFDAFLPIGAILASGAGAGFIAFRAHNRG